MTRNRIRTGRFAAYAVAALLIVSCVAGAGVAAAGDAALLDLDENTPLTDKATWSEYEQAGVATADVAAPDLEITVAKEHEDVDVDGFHNDYSNEWVRVEYKEEIERTIRFYVPSNYWKPYYDESVDAVTGDQVTAKFVPVEGGRYTAVSITFDGPTTAVFPASQAQGVTWSFWSREDAKLENATGVSTGIGGTDQWNYAQATDWSNGTYVVENVSDPDRVMIQYDAGVGSSESVWLRVPNGESSRTPVYYFVRSSASASSDAGGERATIVVVSKQEDPPAIRLKKNASTRDGLGSILNDWSRIPDRFRKFVDDVFGSGSK